MQELMTTKEVAAYLRRSYRTIQRMTKKGLLQAYSVAGNTQKYYKRSEIEEVIHPLEPNNP
jgi:excisionase family DNA binding protein